MDNFELNKTGWFTVDLVEPNTFLNDKLESDQYGIYYSVKFEGDASTHLWQAKTAPTKGEKVYGHIEMAKSGKSTKFKRAKKEEIPASTNAAEQSSATTVQQPKDNYWPNKDAAIRAQWAIGQAKDWVLGNALNFDDIEQAAADFFAMVERVKVGAPLDTVVEPSEENFNLDDVPYFDERDN